MAAPQTKRHETLVQDFAAGAQGASATPLDFTEGSVFLSLGEAVAGMGTWLQKLYVFALSVTRLVSSQGIWVDTFIAPFGMTRLGNVAATGLVTFSRYSATAQTVIPLGTAVSTSDGSQTFQVYADPSNPSYSASAGTNGAPGYVFLPGSNAIQVPVQALNAGVAGNVAANTISRIQSPIPADAVINAAGFTNGIDRESDAQVKVRFRLFIASLFKGTVAALAYAISSVQNGLNYQILSNIDPAGAFAPGFVTIYVDDGSGAIPAAPFQAVTDACWATRAAGIRIAVLPAKRHGVLVQLTLSVAPGYDKPTVEAQVTAAITLAINGLSMSDTLIRAQLIKAAFAASSGIVNITDLVVNGTAADLPPRQGETFVSDSVQVS